MKKSTVALIIIFIITSIMGVVFAVSSVIAIRSFALDWLKVFVDKSEFSWEDSDFVFDIQDNDEVNIDMNILRVYVKDDYVYVQLPFLVIEIDDDRGLITANTEDFDGPRISDESDSEGSGSEVRVSDPTISSTIVTFPSLVE